MKLDDSNSLEHSKGHEAKDNILASFMKELQKVVSNFIKSSSLVTANGLLEDPIYVVRDINDKKLSLVDINNGEDFDIYAITSNEQMQDLHSKGISDNIYEMSKEEFYNLNLGSNITIKNGKCMPYYGEVKIENPEAARKLEDMYFCLEQEKDAIYSVTEISGEKIYLTNTLEGGHFSIPKEAYPNFKVGDLVKNNNGKYVLM